MKSGEKILNFNEVTVRCNRYRWKKTPATTENMLQVGFGSRYFERNYFKQSVFLVCLFNQATSLGDYSRVSLFQVKLCMLPLSKSSIK